MQNTTIDYDNVTKIAWDVLDKLWDHLPHGSGIDGDWGIHQPTNDLVVAHNSYHAMNPVGFYIGWIDFTLKYHVKTDEIEVILNPFDVEILQNEHGHQAVLKANNLTEDDEESEWIESWSGEGLEDYLRETIDHSLNG